MPTINLQTSCQMVGSRSLSSGVHSRDPVAFAPRRTATNRCRQPTPVVLWSCGNMIPLAS